MASVWGGPCHTSTSAIGGPKGSSLLFIPGFTPLKVPCCVFSGYSPPNILSKERFSNITTTTCSMPGRIADEVSIADGLLVYGIVIPKYNDCTIHFKQHNNLV